MIIVFVYVVMIESEEGTSATVHSVHASEESAEHEVQELSSRLSDDMVVTYEPHEVQE